MATRVLPELSEAAGLPEPPTEPSSYTTPAELLSQFTKIIIAEELDTNGDGESDTVRVDGHSYPKSDWVLSKFNLLGRRIERDNAQKVKNNKELIKEFNKYDFKASALWKCTGTGSAGSCPRATLATTSATSGTCSSLRACTT